MIMQKNNIKNEQDFESLLDYLKYMIQGDQKNKNNIEKFNDFLCNRERYLERLNEDEIEKLLKYFQRKGKDITDWINLGANQKWKKVWLFNVYYDIFYDFYIREQFKRWYEDGISKAEICKNYISYKIIREFPKYFSYVIEDNKILVEKLNTLKLEINDAIIDEIIEKKIEELEWWKSMLIRGDELD